MNFQTFSGERLTESGAFIRWPNLPCPFGKKIVFHHRKIGKHWPPWPIIGIFTKLNFLATPPHNDMVDFNGIKPFLFHL